MLVYVDAILIASLPKYATNAAGKFLESVYQMSDFGFLGFELDFGVEKNRYCIMHQERYINEMLENYSVEGRPALSPWEPGVDLIADDQAEEGWETDFDYRGFCGSAIYISTNSTGLQFHNKQVV